MTADPMRLADGSSSALARELLGQAKGDAAGELLRASAQRAAEQALTGALAGGGTTTLVSSSLAKWLGSLLLVGAAGVGVVTALAPGESAEPVTAPRAVPAAAPAPAKRVTPSEAREPESVSVDDLPLAPAASSDRAVGRGARPSASADRLEREIAVLDRARQALGAGNTELALAELDEHATELEILRPEAESLRIEALYASGRQSEADARANRFLASHGKSPLAARVLSLKNTHEKAKP